jgi:hypothetical protein
MYAPKLRDGGGECEELSQHHSGNQSTRSILEETIALFQKIPPQGPKPESRRDELKK